MTERWQERLQNYKKSISNLEETIQCINQNGLNKIYIMALVQAFEICFELGWKTMKDYLEYNGISSETPRETIKAAFSSNLIKDGTKLNDKITPDEKVNEEEIVVEENQTKKNSIRINKKNG